MEGKKGSVVTVKVGDDRKVGVIEKKDGGTSTIRIFGLRTLEHYCITVPDDEIIEVVQE